MTLPLTATATHTIADRLRERCAYGDARLTKPHDALSSEAADLIEAQERAIRHFQNAKPTIQRMPQTPARDEALQWFDRAEAALDQARQSRQR